jgi:hypothetical protein
VPPFDLRGKAVLREVGDDVYFLGRRKGVDDVGAGSDEEASPDLNADAGAVLHSVTGKDLTRYARVKVLRHPAFADMNAAGLWGAQQWLVTQAGFLNCLAYPPASAFAQVVAASRLPTVVAQVLGRLPARGAADGPFCSELVASLFDGYGLPLFSGARPNAISPSALARTVLREVPCVNWGPPRILLRDLRATRAARRIAAIPKATLNG